jgi:ribosomal protein S18 acetylase RimI-like enzyme
MAVSSAENRILGIAGWPFPFVRIRLGEAISRGTADDLHLPPGYTTNRQTPEIEDYRRLRRICGLTPRSAAAAEAGLPNTVFAVIIHHADQVIGMGRVVGDGALFLHIVDIAIDPAHQGRGLGKVVMAALMAHIAASAPAEAHVSLMADGDAHRLYAQFGFEPVAPRSQGMAVLVNKPPA